MTIYLVRHGETDWNKQNRLQGIEDIELNETGLKQSADCALAFKRLSIDCVLSSPLKRAKKTAEIIAGHLGIAPVIVEPDLTERDFGRLSGMTPAERQAIMDSEEETFAEPLETLIDRFMNVLNKVALKSAYENVIVVSHGASINAALSYLSGGLIGTGKTVLKNTCISKLSCADSKMEIIFHNMKPGELLEAGP